MRIDETEWTPLCEKHYREKIARLTRFMEFRLWLARLALRLCTWLVPSPMLPALLREDDSPAADHVPAGSDDGHGYVPFEFVEQPYVPLTVEPTSIFPFQPVQKIYVTTAVPASAQGPTDPEETHAEPRPKRLH